nr:MAG TPA: hypothetical protein [Caudoviricetes sp.]
MFLPWDRLLFLYYILFHVLVQVYILHKYTCVSLCIIPLANILVQVYNDTRKAGAASPL